MASGHRLTAIVIVWAGLGFIAATTIGLGSLLSPTGAVILYSILALAGMTSTMALALSGTEHAEISESATRKQIAAHDTMHAEISEGTPRQQIAPRV
jgi:hypothetical protein